MRHHLSLLISFTEPRKWMKMFGKSNWIINLDWDSNHMWILCEGLTERHILFFHLSHFLEKLYFTFLMFSNFGTPHQLLQWILRLVLKLKVCFSAISENSEKVFIKLRLTSCVMRSFCHLVGQQTPGSTYIHFKCCSPILWSTLRRILTRFPTPVLRLLNDKIYLYGNTFIIKYTSLSHC